MLLPAGWSIPLPDVPYVAMAQNMLPLMPVERKRYGLSWMRTRLAILGRLQLVTFKNSAAVICHSDFSRRLVQASMAQDPPIHVVAHGIEGRFFRLPEEPRVGTNSRPLRILYVSKVDAYKHQWVVAQAIAQLRDSGRPVEGVFVGGAYGPSLRKLEAEIARLDPLNEFLQYHGAAPPETVHEAFHKADIFVFASTCEAFSLIIGQAMAAGLPIVALDAGPVREIVGDAAVLVPSLTADSLAAAIARLFDDLDRRRSMARIAFERAHEFTWQRAAEQTMAALIEAAVARPRSWRPELGTGEFKDPKALRCE